MLARLGCCHADNGVPVVRCTNRNRINVSASHDFTVITVLPAILIAITLIHDLCCRIHAIAVYVANRHHLDRLRRQKRPHVSIALTTLANRGHHDLIVCSKSTGGDNGRKTDHRGSAHE
jgi:hypothetical protein